MYTLDIQTSEDAWSLFEGTYQECRKALVDFCDKARNEGCAVSPQTGDFAIIRDSDGKTYKARIYEIEEVG